jgi:TrmH family RNA methyltransferase
MISRNKLKLINSLSQKKYRDETGLFVAEGTKLVLDLSPSFQCSLLVTTTGWLNEHIPFKAEEIIEVNDDEFSKISGHKSPQGVLALFVKPSYNWNYEELSQELSLALDNVQDPGNLGTIIRVADWFGIHDIFCSEHSVDAFNPKTVQATMGALARVRVHTVNLIEFFLPCKGKLPIYGTFMYGENIYSKPLSQQGIIVMGNEGNGISSELEKLVTERLLIPSFPVGNSTSESLNVSVATALICAEFRRRM